MTSKLHLTPTNKPAQCWRLPAGANESSLLRSIGGTGWPPRLSVANCQKALPEAPVPIAEVSATPHLALSNPARFLMGAGDHPSPYPGPTALERNASQHPFWDRENLVLFSLLAGSRGLDYSSTLNMRRRGRQEVLLTKDVVDNHPAFAAIEAGGTAVSFGASYLFHRYHHHGLERWTSIIHTSLATSGAVRNYCLKTAYTSPVP
jgi:hypothetical protein